MHRVTSESLPIPEKGRAGRCSREPESAAALDSDSAATEDGENLSVRPHLGALIVKLMYPAPLPRKGLMV